MATKIVTKNSSTASAVPTASDLVQGELAVNVADKRLFTEDNAGAIVELGTNPSGNVTFQDNGKAIFGAGSDLQIYHDGSNSYLKDAGTGDLYIQGEANVRITDGDGNKMFLGQNDGEVQLYYNGYEKLNTTSTGIDVTGTATMDGLTASTSGNQIMLVDSVSGATTIQMRTGSGSLSNFIRSGIGGSANLRFETTGNVVRQKIDSNGDISFYEDTGTTPKLFWDASAESLGIGTTSLTTSDGSNVELSAATSSRVILASTGTGGRKWTMATGTTGSLDFYDYDASAYRMRIDASGRVGIGTSSPAVKFDVNGDGLQIRLDGTANTSRGIMLRNTGTAEGQIQTDGNMHFIQEDAGRYMRFSTANTERMRIDSSGNLLVGATTLANVNNIISNHLFEGGNSTAGNAAVGVYNNTGTANCAAFNVLNRDASTDTSNRFVQFYANVTSSGATAMGGIVGNGASNVQFAALSDVREKTNIESINGSLDKIKALNPVEFDWIASGEHCKAGFVAQEVEEVFPEFVVENMASEGEEERKGLTGGMTGGIVAHLVKAIQEQQILIESLTARIAALEE
jgi:hypothetical protein